MIILYILLSIIAVGVLLQTEQGKKILFFAGIFCGVSAVLYLVGYLFIYKEIFTYRQTPSLFAQVLVVGGGGGGVGQNSGGGGGGAGGYLYESAYAIVPESYSITVGTGGSGNINGSDLVGQGATSSFDTMIASGGGSGGGESSAANGGSGGGADPLGPNPGTGILGQGHNGGTSGGASGYGSGGGGGCGATGGSGSSSAGGAGGNGCTSSISGSSVTYAGGGGGGVYNSGTGGAGGSGGGGAGGNAGTNPGVNGTANTGGGGGGSGRVGSPAQDGGTGGSGVVIIRYNTADWSGYTVMGGTVTTSGSDTIHTFTSSGTFTLAIRSFFSRLFN